MVGKPKRPLKDLNAARDAVNVAREKLEALGLTGITYDPNGWDGVVIGLPMEVVWTCISNYLDQHVASADP